MKLTPEPGVCLNYGVLPAISATLRSVVEYCWNGCHWRLSSSLAATTTCSKQTAHSFSIILAHCNENSLKNIRRIMMNKNSGEFFSAVVINRHPESAYRTGRLPKKACGSAHPQLQDRVSCIDLRQAGKRTNHWGWHETKTIPNEGHCRHFRDLDVSSSIGAPIASRNARLQDERCHRPRTRIRYDLCTAHQTPKQRGIRHTNEMPRVRRHPGRNPK